MTRQGAGGRACGLWRYLYSGALLLILLAVSCPAEEGISKSDLYMSIWVRRQAIADGWFEIERHAVEHRPDGSSMATDASYTIGISGPMTLFDANADALIGHGGASGIKRDIESERVRIQRRRVLYAQTETQTYLYLDHGAQLQVGLPPEMAKRAAQFFDIRRLGLEMAPGPKAISSGSVEMVQTAAGPSDAHKVQMDFVYLKDGTRTSVVIDPTTFGVTRVEGISADGHFRAVAEIENAMDKISGIVFPKRVRIHDYVGGVLASERVFTVKKAMLNGSVDERRFRPDQFYMATDTMVIDMATRRPLGVWNGRMFVEKPGIEVDSAKRNAIYGRATKSKPAH